MPFQRRMLHVPLFKVNELKYYYEPTSRKYSVSTVATQNGVITMKYLFFILAVTNVLQGMEEGAAKKNLTTHEVVTINTIAQALTGEEPWKQLPQNINLLMPGSCCGEPLEAFYRKTCFHCKAGALYFYPHKIKVHHLPTCSSAQEEKWIQEEPSLYYESQTTCPYFGTKKRDDTTCEKRFSLIQSLGNIIRIRERLFKHIEECHLPDLSTKAPLFEFHKYILYRQLKPTQPQDKKRKPPKKAPRLKYEQRQAQLAALLAKVEKENKE